MCLEEKRCSPVGTIHQNQREIPDECKVKKQLLETEVFSRESKTGIILTSYQSKPRKNVAILSSLHPDVQVPSKDNPEYKSKIVLYYNQMKVRVDIYDHASRMYSVNWLAGSSL